MVFKKSLSALVFVLPLVIGTDLCLGKYQCADHAAGASISRRSDVPSECAFLLPIVDTLVDDLFTNECGDAVCLDFPLNNIGLTVPV
jgi:hypothetical protein